MPGGAYLTYLNFGETLIILSCQITSLILNLRLVYISRFNPQLLEVKRLSFSLLAYLYTYILASILALPGNVYMGINWSPTASNHSPYALYWLGLLASNYHTASPVLVLMLAIDRCIVLKMPLHTRHLFQSIGGFLKMALIWVPFAMVAIFVFVGNIWVYLLELPLDLERVITCQVFPCLAVKYRSSPQLMGKVIISIANLIIYFVFFYELKRSGKAHLVNNRVVKRIILFELIFDVIPAITGYAFRMIVGETPANYLGQYTMLVTLVTILMLQYSSNIRDYSNVCSMPNFLKCKSGIQCMFYLFLIVLCFKDVTAPSLPPSARQAALAVGKSLTRTPTSVTRVSSAAKMIAIQGQPSLAPENANSAMRMNTTVNLPEKLMAKQNGLKAGLDISSRVGSMQINSRPVTDALNILPKHKGLIVNLNEIQKKQERRIRTALQYANGAIQNAVSPDKLETHVNRILETLMETVRGRIANGTLTHVKRSRISDLIVMEMNTNGGINETDQNLLKDWAKNRNPEKKMKANGSVTDTMKGSIQEVSPGGIEVYLEAVKRKQEARIEAALAKVKKAIEINDLPEKIKTNVSERLLKIVQQKMASGTLTYVRRRRIYDLIVEELNASGIDQTKLNDLKVWVKSNNLKSFEKKLVERIRVTLQEVNGAIKNTVSPDKLETHVINISKQLMVTVKEGIADGTLTHVKQSRIYELVVKELNASDIELKKTNAVEAGADGKDSEKNILPYSQYLSKSRQRTSERKIRVDNYVSGYGRAALACQWLCERIRGMYTIILYFCHLH